LGPVQPMVVPSPPLSLSTTSLSSSFFVSSRSTSQRNDPISVHTKCVKDPRSDPPATTTTLHLTKIKSERAIIPSGGDARVSYGTTTSSVGVWILLHSICSASPLQNATAQITQLTSRCAQSNHTERICGIYLPEVA
jgi:hypothetical protein